MQASINAIRQRSSSLAGRFIRSNKINVDFSYPTVGCINRRFISNEEMPGLSNTLKENKYPLVSSRKLDFNKKLKDRFPEAPDTVLALVNAVNDNNSSLVRNLIKSNEIDVNYVFPPWGNTVLHLAASMGYMDIAKILVEEGHALCCKDMFDFLPIHSAAQNYHIDLVKYFSDLCPETKAALVAVRQKNASLVRSLIQSNKVDVDYVYPMEGITPLYFTASDGSVDCICPFEGYTLLHVAASEGSLEIVKILVEEGHASSFSTEIGECPIHLAANEGHVDVVRYLAGTDRNGSYPEEIQDMLDSINSEKK